MIARRLHRHLAAALALSLSLGWLAAPAHAQDPERATLSVVGEGEAAAAPDMATFSTGVVASGKTAEEALAANSKSMGELISAIKAIGIEDRDIATSGFSISPQYSQPAQNSREAPRLVGFEVRNTVGVKVRDLTRLGSLLDRMVQAGANQAGGLRFGLADDGPLMEKARVAALKDAQAQAKTLAEAAGMRLLRVRRIAPSDRGGDMIASAPMMMKAEARAVPIEAGELAARARITIVYEVEPI
ncbi:SIMPL domain-containing protein [Aquabacter cavernae]|uniref:SIMPL domain-containing protein n=1 Tax=Aquabacter cavernae TaxID=2496029 RepID=UPI000F8C666B|nr:SIMPL domain-containing protein [Aquabacter cavernae]